MKWLALFSAEQVRVWWINSPDVRVCVSRVTNQCRRQWNLLSTTAAVVRAAAASRRHLLQVLKVSQSRLCRLRLVSTRHCHCCTALTALSHSQHRSLSLVLLTEPVLNRQRPIQWRPQTMNITATAMETSTRKLCYRKDDRAVRTMYGCPENFRNSLTTSTATFLKILWDFVPKVQFP